MTCQIQLQANTPSRVSEMAEDLVKAKDVVAVTVLSCELHDTDLSTDE